MNILDYFPKGLAPRKQQRDILLALERAWRTHDVFVISAPTACGKEIIATTLAAWSGPACCLVPNNMLLEQYAEHAPKAPVLRKQAEYWCDILGMDCEVAKRKKFCDTCSAHDSCSYLRAIERAHRSVVTIANYYSYLANRLYKPVMIVDEAHLLLNMLQDLATKRVWRHEYGWPENATTVSDIITWLDKYPKLDKKLSRLKEELLAANSTMLVRRVKESWRNKEEMDLLKMVPLDMRNEPPLLWPPGRVAKIVFLSATIGRHDIASMGLSNRRVFYVDSDSPIPEAKRPIVYDPVANMSYANQAEGVGELAEYLEQLLDLHSGQRGIIHTTYGMAALLREHLEDNERLIWHDHAEKKAKFEEYRQSEDGVLVACGMQEGIDLVGDLGRFQVITKVPYPSLADPAIRKMAETDSSRYAWAAVRQILQASGRICRTPEDFGTTYVVDQAFSKLYSKHSDLFPKWWKDALERVEGSDAQV